MARLAPLSCPIIVGRDHEFTTGARLLAEAASGQGRFLLLSGEAGIGKSRLARALAETATAQGFHRLVGVCQEHDRTFPFAPLRDALRQHLRHTGTPGAARLFGTDSPLFARLLPELAPTDAAPLPPLPPEEEKRRLFEAFARLFTRLAHTAPLCLILEDLHWADEATLALLHLLPRRLADARVLVVLTARNEEPGDPLAHWQGYLTRNHLITTLDLAPLSRAEVAGMIAATTDTIPASAVTAIAERAEGNPFFVEELLHAWAESGTGDSSPAPTVPSGVRETVTYRLDALGDGVRLIAETAAVIGRRFSFATLRTVTGTHERTLTLALRALVAAYLVVEIEDEQGQGQTPGFAFRHALTREAIYTRLLSVERQRLHRQVAHTLAAEAEGGALIPVGELGYHFHAAGEWDAALRWCRVAGEEALALSSPHAAITHFTRALDAADAFHTSAAADTTVSSTLIHARGKAFWLTGDAEHAMRDYTRALADARTHGDDTTAMRVLMDMGHLWTANDPARSLCYYEAAAIHARTGEDATATAHILARLGYLHVLSGQPNEAEPYAREALIIAQDRHDTVEIARVSQLLAQIAFHRADLVQTAHYAAAAATGFAAAGDLASQALILALRSKGSAALHVDWAVPAIVSLDAGIAEAERAVQIARKSGSHSAETQAHTFLADVLGAQGIYGSALTHARQAVKSATAMENRQQSLLAHSALGLLYRDLLALPHALWHLEHALVIARAHGSSYYVRFMAAFLASLAIEAGNTAHAETLFAELFAPETPTETLVQRRYWLARAELALATSEPDTALRIVNNLIATACNIADLGDRGIPRLSLLRGKALATLGRAAEAEATLVAAAETATAQGAQPLSWRISCALGHLHDSAGDTAKATAAFTAAHQVIAALADTISEERTRTAFAREAAAMIPTRYRSTTSAPMRAREGGLTRRERDVLMQVTRGATNREIAAVLFITEKTVEAHITHSLRKLGLHTRAELVTWAATASISSPNSEQFEPR